MGMNTSQNRQAEAFFQAVLSLKTPEECSAFFADICTVKEVQAMAQRFQVATQLDAGKNYNAVCADTGASSATISRVNRCLLYGKGGYRIALSRMKGEARDGME